MTTPADPSCTLADALRDCRKTLAPLGESAATEAEWLVLRSLELPRTTLLTEPLRRVGPDERARLQQWSARRARGEPLAYLTGEREFWSLTLRVSPDVLVPRPETELLVERALQIGDALERRLGRVPNIVDLGTGSGAIALALAHERPHWNITAIDRSAAALLIAQDNAARLRLPQVRFLLGDWFAPVAAQRFDIVISNPPYVAADDPVMRDDSLRFEPSAALTPGQDALAALRGIIAHAPRHLEADGWLLLEHGHTQGPAVRALLVSGGFGHVVSHPDLAGHARLTQAAAPITRSSHPE